MGHLTPRSIDLNADMGESFGLYRYGADEDVIGHISSANIACGWHAGDPQVMDATIALAARHGVAVGNLPRPIDRLQIPRRRRCR